MAPDMKEKSVMTVKYEPRPDIVPKNYADMAMCQILADARETDEPLKLAKVVFDEKDDGSSIVKLEIDQSLIISLLYEKFKLIK